MAWDVADVNDTTQRSKAPTKRSLGYYENENKNKKGTITLTEMKTVAFLILAHKSPKQIVRLLKALNHPQVDCYLHLDKKMHITEEERAEIQLKGGAILPQRVSCYLDDWSLCEAALLLLNESRRVSSYKYYMLLSGQDYPIKPIPDLIQLLDRNYPKPYIDTTPYSEDNWISYKLWTTKLHSKVKFTCNKVQLKIGCKIRGLNRVQDICQRLSSKFSPSALCQLESLNVKIYGGSAWWALSDLTVNEMMSDIQSNPQIVETFKWVFTPEELFFQTMVMRTSVASMVEVNPVDKRAQNGLTYANFVSPTKEVSCHPHILESEDWEWLKLRPEYFARKFDMDRSPKVLDIIEKSLNNK